MKKTPKIVHISMFSFTYILEILFSWKLFLWSISDQIDLAFHSSSLIGHNLKSISMAMCNDLLQIVNKGS